MNNHQDTESFQCPQCMNYSHSNDHFCSPYQCPRRLPTPLFSSPNSQLSPKELKELKKCIKAANNMLLTIGTKSNPALTRRLQLHFLSLRNVLVTVKIKCDDLTHEITGLLETAGKNFIQLKMIASKAFILYERICSVTYETGDGGAHIHLNELLEINTCIRRELVLNFGSFVSKRPEIANQFIGILLYLQILTFIGCQVSVKIMGEEDFIIGILCESDEGAIFIKTEHEVKQVNFNEICFITLNM